MILYGKIDADYCLWMPYKCAKFQPDQITGSRVMVFCLCKKGEKRIKAWKFAHSNLKNGLCNFLQIWYLVSLGRQAPPQQLWHPSDKKKDHGVMNSWNS